MPLTKFGSVLVGHYVTKAFDLLYDDNVTIKVVGELNRETEKRRTLIPFIFRFLSSKCAKIKLSCSRFAKVCS